MFEAPPDMAEVLDENRPLESVVASSPTLEESYRRATTQGPIIERGLTQISRAGNPKRQVPNCQAGPTASSTPLLLVAQMPWGTHPLCGRPAGYLGDCGSVASCHLTMADRVQGRRADNRPGGDDSDPGLASRRERDPTARRGALEPAWSASTHCEGKGPEDPGASCKAHSVADSTPPLDVQFVSTSFESPHHRLTVRDPDWCQDVTQLKTLEVSQLQCSDKVIHVAFVQVVVLGRPVLGEGRFTCPLSCGSSTR